jgi:hypothetical protein
MTTEASNEGLRIKFKSSGGGHREKEYFAVGQNRDILPFIMNIEGSTADCLNWIGTRFKIIACQAAQSL